VPRAADHAYTLMPAPACTEDGHCRECGAGPQPAGGYQAHTGICSWSLMRSGSLWWPQSWKEAARYEVTERFGVGNET